MKLLSHHNHNHNHNHKPETSLIIIITNLFIYSSIITLIISSKLGLCINNEFYPEERDALLNLRDSLTSNLIDLHARWTGPPCHRNDTNWVGVVCLDSHVVSLVLDDLNLTGSLVVASSSTFLQNVTYLTSLSFSNNSLSGRLPDLTGLVRLRALSFKRNRFSGPIPPELAGLPGLEALELQHNRLSGQIPPFDQPSLAVFNVSDNGLSGPIPGTSVLRGLPGSCFGENPGLCGEPLETACRISPAAEPPAGSGEGEKKKRRLGVLGVALIAGFVPVLVVIIGLLFYCRVVHGKELEVTKEVHAEKSAESPKSSTSKDPERGVELEFLDKEIPVFDLDDLLRSSAELLGKGTLGTTYKTTLETGQCLAVKRLNKDMNELSKKEFEQQMQLLGKTCRRHENLVKIVSFYYSKDEKLVVYEFVPDGTLFELLHENRGVGREPLTWETRLSIIKDIAKGLTFLHQSLPHHKVPHANLKSSNVLIQRNANNNTYFRSKLTDLGFFPLAISPRRATDGCKLAVARSPEHAQGKRLSRKSDIYCFGIIILEIITGRIPGEISPATEERTEDLSDWVRMVVNTDWSTDILDIEIAAAREEHDEMLKLTEIALQCTDIVPEKRPKMSEVLQRIEEIEQSQRENE